MELKVSANHCSHCDNSSSSNPIYGIESSIVANLQRLIENYVGIPYMELKAVPQCRNSIEHNVQGIPYMELKGIGFVAIHIYVPRYGNPIYGIESL